MSTIDTHGFYPWVSIKSSPPESITRFVFDGQKIVEYYIKNIDPEVYYISHELAHAVSFLESSVTEIVDWNARKKDWKTFLTTDRMKPINAALSDAGLNQEAIYNLFEKFFTNTEEARNLLGFTTTNKTFVGEFCFFNEKNNFLLPTYLNNKKELETTEIIFLRKIGKLLGIQFQKPSSCSLL